MDKISVMGCTGLFQDFMLWMYDQFGMAINAPVEVTPCDITVQMPSGKIIFDSVDTVKAVSGEYSTYTALRLIDFDNRDEFYEEILENVK